MNSIVVHLTSIDNSMIASAKIAKYLSELLRLPIKDRGNGAVKSYDVIYLVNGPPAFCNWRNELAAMVAECGTLVFVQNDYTIYPPSQVNKVMGDRNWYSEKGHYKPPYIWSTVESKLRDDRDQLINWNCLAYSTPIDLEFSKRKGMIYYGSFRYGRGEYFGKYFQNYHGPQPLTISCPPRAVSKFRDITGDRVSFALKFEDLKLALSQYKYSIYMEDVYSHKNYCHPANRFYECLSAGVFQFVDENSAHTLERAGYIADDYIVSHPHHVNKMMNSPSIGKLRTKQLKEWGDTARTERRALNYKVRKINKLVRI